MDHWVIISKKMNERETNKEQTAEACPGFFHQGQIPFLEIFSSGPESRLKSVKKFCLSLKKFCPWGITDNKGGGEEAEYLINIITKYILLWAPVPNAPMRAFFQGMKKYYFEFHQGHMPLMPHGWTRLWVYFSEIVQCTLPHNNVLSSL